MIERFSIYLASPSLGAKLIKATMGGALLRILGMFFVFLVGVQLARGLGAEGYGIYGLAMAILALLTVPTEFGLPQLITREVAAAQAHADWGMARGLLAWSRRKVLTTSVVVGFGVVLWLTLSSGQIYSPLGFTLLAGIVMVPMVALGKLSSAALGGLQHLVEGQLADVVLRPAVFSLLLFLLPAAFGIYLSPAIAMGLGAVAAGVALVVASLLLRRAWSISSDANPLKVDGKNAWRNALPMALTEGMRMLQGHLAIFVLGALSTVAVVGTYRVASSMAILLAAPLTLFNVIGMPLISRLFALGDTRRLQRLLGWLALGMFASCLVLAAPFWHSGERLLGWIFGAEFVQSGDSLSILAIGVVINAFFGANAALLNMTRYANRVTIASSISLGVLAVLLFGLVPLLGGVGAAIAWSGAMTAWNGLMWWDSHRLLGLDTSVLCFLSKK